MPGGAEGVVVRRLYLRAGVLEAARRLHLRALGLFR